jgi:hypothetical protein
MAESQPPVTEVSQPLTDDSIRVRQVSHYQFSRVAREAGRDGVWTLQLVLDQGAWEEVLTVSGEDRTTCRTCSRRPRSSTSTSAAGS